jgi:hypothetical protein
MPRIPFQRHLAAAVLAVLSLTLGRAALAWTPPPFPRIAGVQISAPFDYENPSYEAALAKQAFMILNYWPGLRPGGVAMSTVVHSIKAINPNALVFLYTDTEGQATTPSGAYAAYAPFIDKLNAMSWWLHGSTASSLVPSFYGHGTYTINNTPYTAKDSSGEDSIDWITRWFVANYWDGVPGIDGLYVDDVFQEPRVAGDWYNNGVVLAPSNAKAEAALQAGYERWFSLLRQLMPGRAQLGNVATWGVAGSAPVPAGYDDMTNGGVLEQLIGVSYSVESWGGWKDMMNQYNYVMSIVSAPKLVVFNQWGSPTDYQSFRYGFASCLMNDGYYDFTSSSQGYSGVVWFDEYNAKLGEPVGSPPTAAWQKGVWRRDFTGGIALVNPKGNGPQTVSLGGEFVKIRGTQDPAVNNGATVTSVTLQNRDGLILLRQTPLTQPQSVSGLSTGG